MIGVKYGDRDNEFHCCSASRFQFSHTCPILFYSRSISPLTSCNGTMVSNFFRRSRLAYNILFHTLCRVPFSPPGHTFALNCIWNEMYINTKFMDDRWNRNLYIGSHILKEDDTRIPRHNIYIETDSLTHSNTHANHFKSERTIRESEHCVDDENL